MVQKKCNICDRRFNKTEHFKRHERSHTNERPYECTLCHKRFSRSDVLSRHAKSHDEKIANLVGKRTNQSLSENSHNALASATVSTLASGTTPAHTQGVLPSMCTDALAIQTISASSPGIPLPPSTDLPPSSLDFLANVSAHHAYSITNDNPMMMDDQQAYFGWNRAATGQQPEEISNEALQLWLQPRRDTYSTNGSDLMGSPGLGLTRGKLTMSPDHQHTHSADSTKSGNITTERFAKVQRYWLVSSNGTSRLMNSLWRDVVYNDLDNLFAVQGLDPSHSQADLLQGSHYGLDQECKLRLQAAFDQSQFVNAHQQPLENDSISQAISLPDFPPAEILNMALKFYFSKFHPLIPFVHLPTFSAANTQLPLLYIMCLIGMAIMETKATTDFISKSFQFILDRVTADLEKSCVGSESPLSTISIFATAFLFLNLAAMTGEMGHFEKCQSLYVNLMSIAQRHGLFVASEGQLLDIGLYEAFPDPSIRWKAWSKVESTKRLIAGLLHLDSSYSSFLSTSPIIAPGSIQLILPCNENLFRANSPVQWMQSIKSGKSILMPTIIAPSENVSIPALGPLVGDFCIQGVLAMVYVRLSEAYHRLLSGHAGNRFAPCQTYAMDGRARSLPLLQVQIVSGYGELFQKLNHNTLVMWHSMCLRLTADVQIFDLAAGRAGPVPARQALNDIAAWSQTPAARRACLHAAHIYKSMTIRKTSDLPTFHSVISLFSAALVLGLYSFILADSPEPQAGLEGIELLDEVDWRQVGTEGFTSFMEPHESHSLTPAANAATDFIRNGGSVYFRGFTVNGGSLAARRILLDYAGLLKDLAPWTVRKFSYVLQIVSDVLMDME